MATTTIQVPCDKCGGQRASQVVEVSYEPVSKGYWGDRPEEYGHYPGDDWPSNHKENRKILRFECPDCIATIISLSTVISEQLLELLNGAPDRLQSLSPQLFELLIEELLDKMGFNVARTGKATAPDGGIDLLALPKTVTVGVPLIGVQVKHHSADRKVGLAEVDRLLSWRGGPFQMGLCITNTDFTVPAKERASNPRALNFIRLRNGQDVQRWLRGEYSSREELNEVPEYVELTSGVVVPVPKPVYGSAVGLWPTFREAMTRDK